MAFSTRPWLQKKKLIPFPKWRLRSIQSYKRYLSNIGIELIDFKLEFGRYHGQIILADEISPDTCRYWDIEDA